MRNLLYNANEVAPATTAVSTKWEAHLARLGSTQRGALGSVPLPFGVPWAVGEPWSSVTPAVSQPGDTEVTAAAATLHLPAARRTNHRKVRHAKKMQ